MKIQNISIIFILAFSLILSPKSSLANGIDQAIDVLSEKLMPVILEYDQPVVVVTDFHNLNEEVCDLGRYVSRKLIQRLGQIKNTQIVERSQLDQFGSEVQLDPTSPESVSVLMNNLNANLLIFGDVTKLQSSIEIARTYHGNRCLKYEPLSSNSRFAVSRISRYGGKFYAY